ncbi:MAG: hypothetical protein AABY75_05600 [Bacteroidota bacterium]
MSLFKSGIDVFLGEPDVEIVDRATYEKLKAALTLESRYGPPPDLKDARLYVNGVEVVCKEGLQGKDK